MTEISDEALLLAYRDGDSGAFRSLFERYRDPLFNFVLRRVRDRARAEELYQDVWTTIIERNDGFRGDARFSTWVYKIARNRCIDHQRRMTFRVHQAIDASPSRSGPTVLERTNAPGPATDDLAAASALQRRIAIAVQMLPDDQQEVFLLRHLQGLAFQEIAEVVEAPVNTVKSRMRYALERLQHQLADLP